MIAAMLEAGRDRIRTLFERLRYHVRLRTRLRSALRRLRIAMPYWIALPPRWRSRRARAVSRRRRRQIAALDELPGARALEGLAPPPDSRRILRGAEASGPDSIDVVVCVHDALAHVHRCLASVLESSGRPLRLIVVDDGSGEATAAYLDRFKATNPAVDLRRNAGPARGYTVAANTGLRASTAEYVVLLNSDAIVTRGWLEHLVAAGRSGDDVGIVGPLSNAASYQSVPELRLGGEWTVNELPEWLTVDAMAALVVQLSGEDVIRVPFLNGFCYCIRRRVIDAIGLLDEEHFAEGYSEENDYACRAADAGFALAVAPRAYVAHAKSRSYGREGREDLAERNYARFLSKHGEDRVRKLVADLERNASLAAVRQRVAEATVSPQATAAHLPRLGVTFVLPGLSRGGSGGSHSIYQETSTMRSLGLPARIAVDHRFRERVEDAYPEADGLFVFYRDDEELAARLAGDDVVVATHFKSAPSVARLVADRRVRVGAYYVQDYEPLFAAAGSADAIEASESYRLIPNGVLFAKADWIRDTLFEREGLAAAKVEPSLDRDLFHAEGRAEPDELTRIVAMLRPRTPRRAARETVDILTEVAERYGSRVRIATFGCDAGELAELGEVPSSIDHRGLLSRQDVAELLRTSDVFLDCSWYQAFGRTSLEAMACGATAVLPEVGGTTEFAEHEVNSLLVDTRDHEETYAAVARLVEDRGLLRRLQASALQTAGHYSSLRAALSEYTLFCHELATRPKPQGVRVGGSPTQVPTVDDIDWARVDFVDLGCSIGGSVRYCAERFHASRGLGVDSDERKVARAIEGGIEAAVGDATRLTLPSKVRFVSAMDFFEHLPDLSAVRTALESAAGNATDFIYIRHPSFEGQEPLEALGLCQYWWRWHGHRTHIRVSDYRELFEALGLDQYMVRYLDPIEHSSHPSILPAGAPIDQREYDPDKHGPKPDVSFDTPVWRAQEIFIALRPIEPKPWKRLTARWGKDKLVAVAGG
jgi:O-antigen biosynthesis protein